MNRLLTACVAAALALTAGCATAQATGADDPSYVPFAWDRVPLYGHLGKRSGDFTQDEARFVASTFAFVTIEKGQAYSTRGSTEAGTLAAVEQLKALNPDLKVLFYWNAFIDYPLYAATEAKRPDDAFLRRADGEFDTIRDLRRWDLSQEAVRSWWVDAAVRAIATSGADGIFVDALPQVAMNRVALAERLGPERAAAVQEGSVLLIQELRAALGADAIIVYNGLRAPSSPNQWADGGARYQPWASYAMLEHFAFQGSVTPEQMAADIALVQDQARRGEGVVFKGWPTFSWLDTELMSQPIDVLAQRARVELDFALAAYLIAAGEHIWFNYSWGYRDNHGNLTDYPALRNRLGSPQGEAVRTGWQYTRAYAHAQVNLDLETRTGQIVWR